MAEPRQSEPEDDTVEIRCLWQKTDYGHVSLRSAARGYGGRELGSYQDRITDENFARIRHHEHEVNPTWPLAEAVVKVPLSAVEALFTDGTEIEALPGHRALDEQHEVS